VSGDASGSAGGGRARSRLRRFNPNRLGGIECGVWVAYYRRDWARFLPLSIWLVREAFGMDWIRTIHGAWLVLRGNQLWAPYPDNDADGARRCMRRFYALVKLSYGVPANPAKAAELEVAWWAAHREHQHGERGEPTPLIDALAKLYAYVYGANEAALRPAAQHRANAMDISDQWVEEGCEVPSALVAEERAELVRSYAALLTAVHR
jgi:hypothetical protein